MILTIDIGNTAISFNFDSSKTSYEIILESNECTSTQDCSNFLKSYMKSKNIDSKYIKEILVCSVVDSLEKFVITSVKEIFNAKISHLHFSSQNIIDIKIETPEKLGTDMIATAIGASTKNDTATCIVDLGTATTISLINNKKQFIAYNIMPGVKLQLESLAKGTFQLPKIKPKFSKDILGKNTNDAILSGVLRGHGNAINGLIKNIHISFPYLKVFVTGGLNGYVRDYLDFEYQVENKLIHIGLKYWAENKK